MNPQVRPPAPWRAPRGAAVGSLAWATVVAGHVVAAGALPSVGTLAVTATIAAAVGMAFAGRRFTWRRSFSVLLLLQPLLHLALATLGQGAHHHHTLTDAPASWTMPVAHLVAAALAAWWITTGDRLLLTLADGLLTRFAVRSTPRVPTIQWLAMALVDTRETDDRAQHSLTLGALTRRGPPQVCTG